MHAQNGCTKLWRKSFLKLEKFNFGFRKKCVDANVGVCEKRIREDRNDNNNYYSGGDLKIQMICGQRNRIFRHECNKSAKSKIVDVVLHLFFAHDKLRYFKRILGHPAIY